MVINLDLHKKTHSFYIDLYENPERWDYGKESVVITTTKDEKTFKIYDFEGNLLYTFDNPGNEEYFDYHCYSNGRLSITSGQQSSTIQSQLYSFYSFKDGEEDFIGKTRLEMFSCGDGYVNFDDYWNTDDEHEQLTFK